MRSSSKTTEQMVRSIQIDLEADEVDGAILRHIFVDQEEEDREEDSVAAYSIPQQI